MAKPKQNMIRCMVFLKPEHIEKLKARQEETGARLAEIVRRALDEYFSKKGGTRG